MGYPDRTKVIVHDARMHTGVKESTSNLLSGYSRAVCLFVCMLYVSIYVCMYIMCKMNIRVFEISLPYLKICICTHLVTY